MRCRPLLKLAILSGLVPMLPGCAGSLGKLNVDLKALKECQRLDGSRSTPSITEDTDYRDLAADALAHMNKANAASARRTKCENDVIAKYAKAG